MADQPTRPTQPSGRHLPVVLRGADPPDAATCPSCGANLTADGEPRAARRDRGRRRSVVRGPSDRPRRAAGCCRGSAATTRAGRRPPVDAGALAPPDPDVQREILRLELEAEVAEPPGRGRRDARRAPSAEGRVAGPARGAASRRDDGRGTGDPPPRSRRLERRRGRPAAAARRRRAPPRPPARRRRRRRRTRRPPDAGRPPA